MFAGNALCDIFLHHLRFPENPGKLFAGLEGIGMDNFAHSGNYLLWPGLLCPLNF